MKKYFQLLMVLFFAATIKLSAQNIGINNTGTAPDKSAMLDISATDKGILIPRMTSVQRNAIAKPAKGLLVYDSSASAFWFHNGTAWASLSVAGGANYWTVNGANIFNNNTGNVGIGLNAPMAPLHIKNDNEALRIQGTTPYLSFYNNAGGLKGFLQSFNNDLYLGTPATNTTGNLQFYVANTPALVIKPTADVVIGADAANSFGKFTVQTLNNSNGISHLGEGGNILATRMGGTSAGIGTFSNTNMRIFSNSNSAVFINSSNSYVGLGGDFPVNKFQIGTITNPGLNYTGNDLAISNGTNAMRVYQSPDATIIASDKTNILLWPKEATGNVGINTLSQPTNKLQIGETGFSGNDLAIGNGSAAMAIYQSNTYTLIGSTTDIVLRPGNNGHGRVGINTNTPRAPLEVSDDISVTNPQGSFYTYLRNGGDPLTGSSNFNPVPNISIMATGRVLATEVDVYSDARIKNIVARSNAKGDLAMLNSIKVTDYTMKDKAKYGSKIYKKVIAQEVEKVYPQVVSKHPDFIPNVYQVADKIEKKEVGYLLHFVSDHHLSHNAKKLRALFTEAEGMKEYNVIAIPSANEVVVEVSTVEGDRVFVYGEEVDDFRTVDYEGLTTLNISATQELSKQLKKQEQQIRIQQEQILILANEIRLLKQPLNKLSSEKESDTKIKIRRGKS